MIPSLQGRSPGQIAFIAASAGSHPQYELVEPLAGPSIHADWLEERGSGFHHVGYVVESLERLPPRWRPPGTL